MAKPVYRIILLSLFAVVGPAYAEFDYDYFELNYRYVDLEAFDDFGQPLPLTANGYGIDFSQDFRNNLIVSTSLYRFDFDDIDGFSTTQDTFKLGAGYHHSFNEFYDVYGTLSYVGIETDFVGGTISDEGFEVIGGVRIWPSDALELNGFIQYSDYDDPLEQTLSEFSATGQARWYFNDTFSVGLGASLGDNTNAYFGNFRMNFGSLPFGL